MPDFVGVGPALRTANPARYSVAIQKNWPLFPRFVLVVGAVVCTATCRTANVRSTPPIVQPGAPGEPTRVVQAAQAADVSRIRHTPADVRFVQDMIGHHQQAVEMVAQLESRTASDDMRLLGKRIALSQSDEIAFMRQWLEARGERVPGEHAHHQAATMPGMLSPDEMARLSAATGREFDRLFLEGMIKHHAGALTMVQRLLATPGAGQEVELFSFAADVDADQRMEIERMSAMLGSMARVE